MTSREGQHDGAVERAWQALEARWADDAAHRQFIAFCSANGALSEAGRHYREVRDRDPVRRDEAAKRLDGVLAAAFASLEVARPRAVARRSKLYWMACGVGVALLGYAILYVLRRFVR